MNIPTFPGSFFVYFLVVLLLILGILKLVGVEFDAR